MTEKINVAEILKSKPKGTMLYDKARNISVYLEGVAKATECNLSISCTYGTDRVKKLHYSHKGTPPFFKDGMVILSPSQKMCDWEKFAWKRGDVLVNKDNNSRIIFDKFNDDTYTTFTGKQYYQVVKAGYNYTHTRYDVITQDFDIEKGDAAQIYIDTIEKNLGGKLNRETLEIEKIIFALYDGDIAFADYGNIQDLFIVSGRTFSSDGYTSFITLNLNRMTLSMGCKVSFFNKNLSELRLATEEEKQKLFSALAKEGKVWIPEKKQIVDLKPKWTPKPFERVITRNAADDVWTANIFSHMDSHGEYVTIACVGGYTYCIPYNEDTAKLIGTTDNVEG